MGIEPTLLPWEGKVLPLNYICIFISIFYHFNKFLQVFFILTYKLIIIDRFYLQCFTYYVKCGILKVANVIVIRGLLRITTIKMTKGGQKNDKIQSSKSRNLPRTGNYGI